MVSPIIIEGEEQRNAVGNNLGMTISIANADLQEIHDDCLIPIFEFYKQKVIFSFIKIFFYN